VGSAVMPMFGRAAELRELLVALRDPAVRLVTVTGRGGVGKTRLAVEAAGTLDCQDDCAVVIVSLAGVASPELVVEEIASACNVPPRPHVGAFEALVDVLQDRPTLLVLDNFEHVLDAAGAVSDLVERCPSAKLLVTSQAPLRLRYERNFAIAPLPVPPEDACDADALAQQPAVAIYCARAAAADRSFRLTRDNAPAVAELCRALEGLPLAIELAAARAAMLPAAELACRLDDTGLDLLRHTDHDAPVRHHDLRAAIDCTYQLLEPSEQGLLRRLSLVSGTFDVEMVGGLCRPATLEDAMQQLSALVDFHLVDAVHTRDAARFQLPFSIRAFAVMQLEACGEYTDARRAHVALRARGARAAAAGVVSSDEGAWLRRLELDHDDLIAALDTAIDVDLVDDAIDLVVGLAPLWDMSGFHAAQEERAERAIKLGRQHGRVTAQLSHALSWSALLGLHHGAMVDQTELFDRLHDAASMARAVDDDGALLRALAHTALAMPYSLDVAGAERACEDGLELAARGHHERWRGMFEVLAGMLAGQCGDDDRAIMLGRAAAARARRVGDRRALVLAALLLMPLRRRYPEAAPASLPEEALRAAREARLTLYEDVLLQDMVSAAIYEGDRDAALRLSADSLERALTMPNAATVGYQLMNLVHAAEMSADHDVAAFLHGTIRDSLPALVRHLAPAQVAAYDKRIETAHSALGARFDAEAERGARLTTREALNEALAYVNRARERADEIPSTTPTLTNRQREVLRLIVAGLGNKEIAARLNVSPKTVMHHTTAIYKALDVRTRAEAAVAAVRSGLC
jgi:predicted ATPase/DNA-binding CsgD family transcriptional regulator